MNFKQLNCKFWFIVNCHTSLELFLSKMEAKARHCLTREEKKLILGNQEEGKSYCETAGIIRRSKSAVYRVISRFKADKTLESKPGTGRSPMTIKQKDRMVVEISLKDGFDTAMEKYQDELSDFCLKSKVCDVESEPLIFPFLTYEKQFSRDWLSAMGQYHYNLL